MVTLFSGKLITHLLITPWSASLLFANDKNSFSQDDSLYGTIHKSHTSGEAPEFVVCLEVSSTFLLLLCSNASPFLFAPSGIIDTLISSSSKESVSFSLVPGSDANVCSFTGAPLVDGSSISAVLFFFLCDGITNGSMVIKMAGRRSNTPVR